MLALLFPNKPANLANISNQLALSQNSPRPITLAYVSSPLHWIYLHLKKVSSKLNLKAKAVS